MAQRRMFSLLIVDTDTFMDMPLSAQSLYFHLGMRADDDGFVGSARRIQKLVGAADDDLKILIMKRFVILFDSGVIVIRHWKVSNYIQKDRYHPTIYKNEKATLYIEADGAYTDIPKDGVRPCVQLEEAAENPALSSPSEPVSNMDTNCIPRLGKVSIVEDSIVEDSIVEDNYISGDGERRAREDFDIENDITLPAGVSRIETEKIKGIAQGLFKRYTNRSPTAFDVSQVAFRICVRHTTGPPDSYVTKIDTERERILNYVFEQSAYAGKPGDWNYITGVYAQLDRRGLYTAHDIAAFDFKRELNKGESQW